MEFQADLLGVTSMVVFYLLILFVGIFASWWKRRGHKFNQDESQTAIVAQRDIGIVVGVFTMIATWVGGGYINGTAEKMYKSGLLHVQAPIGYSISLIIGGVFFAKTMREHCYTTMVDPFQRKYGVYVGLLAYLPALCGELLWSASILNALGSSVSVIMNLDVNVSVVLSACIAVTYTFFGGIYSVSYTDIIQLICIAVGLILAIPFAWQSPYVTMANVSTVDPISETPEWLGRIEPTEIGLYVDKFLQLILGGIPWQVYFQRVLSAKSPRRAQLLSYAGGVGCLLMSVPPILIGIVARATDWDSVGDGVSNDYIRQNSLLVLPQVIDKLTPPLVKFVGLGAVAAAVMSSSDSSMLAASSMFAHNIYKGMIRRQASSKEVVWVLRLAIVANGMLGCLIGLTVNSVYKLFLLCSDIVYVLLFPQLLCVIYVRWANSYGVLAGFFVGGVCRVVIGESLLGIAPVFPYDGNFPAKSVVMVASLTAILLVSALSRYVFEQRRLISKRYDVLSCFPKRELRLPTIVMDNGGDPTEMVLLTKDG